MVLGYILAGFIKDRGGTYKWWDINTVLNINILGEF